MTARIIPFPKRPTCFRCAHYDEQDGRCRLFDVPIDSEIFAAQDCSGFEVDE